MWKCATFGLLADGDNLLARPRFRTGSTLMLAATAGAVEVDAVQASSKQTDVLENEEECCRWLASARGSLEFFNHPGCRCERTEKRC
jgi:hypothetical protein